MVGEEADEEVLAAALSSQLDLRTLSDEAKAALFDSHRKAVRTCIEHADEVAQLHNEIVACDDVFEVHRLSLLELFLQKLEKRLLGFQSDLGSIGGDMKKLQEQFLVINHELKNRKKVRKELSQFVDDMVVSKNMLRAITEFDAGSREFLEELHELQHKIQFVRSQEFKEARAVDDVIHVLDALQKTAVGKIREWVLQKIYLFRKPLSNYQVPQHALLKFFYEFLLANDREVAREIQDEYVDTISKMYFSYFKVYTSRLFKLMMTDAASKDDLLGAEDTQKSTGFFSSKPQIRVKATVFSLGVREQLLTDDFLSPLIVPHAAQQGNQKFQFEQLFRSINFALVDHCSHEFLFLSDFFVLSGQPAIEFFGKVMSRAIGLLSKSFEEKVATNFDAISIYLCICLCGKFHQLLLERSVPALNGYWESMSELLWKRFDEIMQMHNESVRTVDVRRIQPPVDTRPHYMLRRYAELTCALLVVAECSRAEVTPKMEAILESQEDAMEQLLDRMAQCFPSRAQRLVFLINNYDLVLSILDERVAKESRIHAIIVELEQKTISEFVEETLRPHFSSLVSFVQDCEPLIEQQHTHLLVRYNEKLSAVVRDFNLSWKKALETINADILRSFTNFKNGSNILQSAFSQLVQYYQRLNKILAHPVFRDSPARSDAVNIHLVMVELKKYKPVY